MLIGHRRCLDTVVIDEAHGWREGYRTPSTNFTSDGTAQTGSMNLLLAFIAWADTQAIKTIMRLFWLFQQTIPMHHANTGELNCQQPYG